ncbi:MAG: helix-turn-helix domain-containing protein [Pseudonocardiaceae bacterium]
MVNPGAAPLCPDCGARLRRGRDAGERCDPCQRTGPRLILPPGFYDQAVLLTALEGLDFGPVFLAIRAHTHWSQESLGEYLGFEQCRISAIENGKRSLHDLGTAIRVANRIGLPAGRLGFTHGVTVGAGTTAGRKGSGVDRRNFVEHVAGLTLVSGLAGLDIDRLTALLPDAEPTGTRHVGAADVEAIEQATATFIDQDFARGSELSQAAAVAHLRSALPLLGAQMSPEVRPRLYLATARLATQTGYMSFDVNQHDAARRLWMIALQVARDADHPLGTDHTVFVLYDMALQAVHLGRPDEAVRLVHLGYNTAAVSSYPVTASTNSCLANIQAKAHAAQGDAVGCDRALGRALDHLAATDSANQETWVTHLIDEPQLAAYQGHAQYTLALTGRDPRAAGRAVPLLCRAVDGFGPGYARSRALYLADLVGAHALAGDVDTAVTLGHQAIDAVTALHSPRAYDRLRVLDTALEPLHTSAGVAELRERLHTTAA